VSVLKWLIVEYDMRIYVLYIDGDGEGKEYQDEAGGRKENRERS
jgi:hypothetical protein